MHDTRSMGKETTLVFVFHVRFYKACVYSEVSELEVKLILREFVLLKTHALYNSVIESDQSEIPIRDKPTEVNCLFRTYETDENNNRAVNMLHSVKQTSE